MSEINIQKVNQVDGDMLQNCTIIKNSTIDEIHKMMKNGDITGAIDLLKQQNKILGTYHPYYPDYSIEIKKIFDKEIPYSKPASKHALKKYPPLLKGKFNIPTKYYGFRNLNELLSYSYRTQTDIEIDMVELKKMLGEVEDPYQDEITTILDIPGGKWKIKPKQFPAAKPYRIATEDSEESFDYVLLRTTKISDNSEIFMSNIEQKTNLCIELVLNLRLKKIVLNLSINDEEDSDKKATLKFLKFIEQAGKGNKLSIISLEKNIVMASGVLDNVNYKSGFNSIQEEIKFLENIIVIEEKYRRKIKIPKYIDQDDFNSVEYLATGIRDGKVIGKWKDFTNEIELVQESMDFWKSINEIPFEIVLRAKIEIIIFDERFEVPSLTRVLKSATFDNIDVLKNKINVLETGDILKVKLIPGCDNNFEDILDFNNYAIT
jgi:hypothetical protein